MNATFHIGTSGYQYDDWRGRVYPPDLPKSEWLSYYARRFRALELNFSFYQMPTARQLASMVRRSEGKLRFAVKAHRSLTHEREGPPAPIVHAFREAVRPLAEAGVLGPVLLQYPKSFHRNRENLDELARLLDLMSDLRPAVEIRGREWLDDTFVGLLRDRGAALVAVDLPALRGLPGPTSVVTAPFAYARFHGRNAAQWWKHDEPWQRYDYRYTKADLAPWVPRLGAAASQAEEVYVFMNNHYVGKAAEGAELLEDLLATAGIVPPPPARPKLSPKPRQGELPF